MARDIRLTKIVTRAGDVAYELSRLNFSGYHPKAGWRPDINAYRYGERIEICVDLAGVEKADIRVEVLPGLLRISGVRQAALPGAEARDCGDSAAPGHGCLQVLAMEIENGNFAREIRLPAAVDPEQISARQDNGLLWIDLPLAAQSTQTQAPPGEDV